MASGKGGKGGKGGKAINGKKAPQSKSSAVFYGQTAGLVP